ncbi:AhpC/TSA family protein [Pseudobacter ginsenosidimutans]|uniref:Peroxiredoxin n=1 Tax=Pseudobacter ginsenosidimutans TaxID=661488 RepID=A0A4Q7N1L7_9BACT|nr:AhpC/TSA family protein [Pseudobacter ginsenosidimutans]QEC44077.1 AhpC/TSA family protein [Pseudobacter ginsenosidimutans]RZS75517.1 peroxiredoxin [Pseudobacter ginsenosidimutans]
MMKKLLSAALCLLALSARSQDELTIEADMKWLPNDTVVYVYDPYSGESDSTFVKNHKFNLTMKMPKGGCAYILQVGRDVSNIEKTATVQYLEPGKMVIKDGKEPGFKHAKYSGSQFVKDWVYVMDNISETSPRYLKLNELEAIQIKATQIGDEDAAEKARNEASVLLKKRNEDALTWVRQNSNSGVASYVIMAWFNKSRDSLIRSLGAHAQKSRISQRILNPGKTDPLPVSFSMGAPAEDKLAPGKEAPAFTTLDENGKEVKLSDFKGKYVFLDFWASWCGPCKPQIPFLKAANDKFKSKNFVMIAISLDGNRDAWLKAVASHKMDWLQLSSLKSWKEPAATAYEVNAIPFNVLIGPDGKILAKGLYNEDIDKKLSELVK